MNWKKLAGQAKTLVDKRGGTDALKADAKQVQAVLKGDGTAKDKAKRVADALKEPGAGPGGPARR
jgi:hypothetical protein